MHIHSQAIREINLNIIKFYKSMHGDYLGNGLVYYWKQLLFCERHFCSTRWIRFLEWGKKEFGKCMQTFAQWLYNLFCLLFDICAHFVQAILLPCFAPFVWTVLVSPSYFFLIHYCVLPALLINLLNFNLITCLISVQWEAARCHTYQDYSASATLLF